MRLNKLSTYILFIYNVLLHQKLDSKLQICIQFIIVLRRYYIET